MGDTNAARTTSRPYAMRARAASTAAREALVLDVGIDLFTAYPYEDVSLDLIAERSGVTKRTLLRRFHSKEGLFVASMGRGGIQEMRRRDAVAPGDIETAVRLLVESYERWGANRLRLLEQEARIPILAANVRIGRDYHWAWVDRTFAPLLDGLDDEARRRRIAGLAAVTDVYTWKVLRLDRGLEAPEVERVLIELIAALKGTS